MLFDYARRTGRWLLRQLARRPSFGLAVVTTLALTIGLNTTLFSAIDALLLRPLPVESSERLVRVYSTMPDDVLGHSPMAPADFVDLATRVRSLERTFAFTYAPVVIEAAASASERSSELVLGELVSAEYFSALGVRPALGAGFDPDHLGSGEPVAMLSDPTWRARFDGDPRVVGKRLRVNGVECTVVGVAPRAFSGLTRGVTPAVWLPLELRQRLAGQPGPVPDLAAERAGRWLWVAGRLAPGFSVDQTRSEIRELAAALRTAYPDTHRDRDMIVEPADAVRILPSIDRRLAAPSAAAQAALVLVLLVACLDLSILTLARHVDRHDEIVTRRALGATRGAVVRLLLAESAVLVSIGGAAGLALAILATRLLNAWRVPIPVDVDLAVGIDARALAFTLALVAAATALSGVLPALAATRERSARAPRHARATGRMVALMLGGQVALSLVLVTAAALMVRSLSHARALDLGFEPRDVAAITVAPGLQGYDLAQEQALFDRLREAVEHLPGTAAVGLASHLPLSFELAFYRAGATPVAEADDGLIEIDAAQVDPGYFDALRVPLRHGRVFTELDRAGAPEVAVINEALSRRLWPGRTPLDAFLYTDRGERWQVVGVVGDGRYRTLGEAGRPFLYRPLAQAWTRRGGGAGNLSTGSITLVQRVEPGSPLLPDRLREALHELDSDLAIGRLTTLEEAIAPALLPARAAAVLFGVVGTVALTLTLVGVYGVAAQTTGRRRHEIGLRMALGARASQVVRIWLRRGGTPVAIGAALGVAGSVGLARFLQGLLYGVRANDPLTLATTAALLVATALVAAGVPALRAARRPPFAVLRQE